MRFRAFLSYSHADAAWARWLLRRLETYRIPSRLVGTPGAHGLIERRLGKFFRDRDELPSAGDLGVTIRAALADSEALVVICSPAAAQSRWVNAEVEAFQASGRGDRVFCFVVDGMPGSEDPTQACFPPALVRTDATGQINEPLAADARAEGDGRERAFLKLVAGLLGVGYDALAQREAQRRTRKFAIVAAASLVGMIFASGLAVTAYVARNDAQRRQAQAEDILGFMLGDLRKKLSTVGRLDLMRSVDDKATGYFATLDPRDMTDRALEEQARSLTGIGEVRLGEGNHESAMIAFREAHARATALHQRAPDNGQRLFDLAQAQYWIGFVAWQQGRLDDAETWLQSYHDSALRLAAMDRTNFAWQREVAYGLHNLAVLDESRDRIERAQRAFMDELKLYRVWLQQHPNDTALRFEASNVISWLGKIADRSGDLQQAEAFMSEKAGALQRNVAQEPDNAEWRVLLVDALVLQARAQAKRGDRGGSLAALAKALPLAESLARQDRNNNEWQVGLGLASLMQAEMEFDSNRVGSEARAAAAALVLAKAQELEPQSERIVRILGMTRNFQAQLAIARRDVRSARLHLSQAESLLRPAWESTPTEGLRLVLAHHHMLLGMAAQLEPNPDAARLAHERSRALLLAEAGDQIPFERLDSLARNLYFLGLTEQAQPHVERLEVAGYVPLHPWPWSEQAALAQRSTH